MRSCDGCTLCCTELSEVTPAGERCDHECEIGCAVYDLRPFACETFRCAWLDELIDEDLKPDKVGWFLDIRESTSPAGNVTVGFAHGRESEEISRAVKDGFVVVTQSGTVLAANQQDERRYRYVHDWIKQLQSQIRRGGT